MCISGMTKSGKSTLTGKLLTRRNEIIQTEDGAPISRVIYCYIEAQPKFFAHLRETVPGIEFNQGLPEEYSDGTDRPSIIVLDDMMDLVAKSDDACAAFTRTSHHRNINLIILVQNFFYKNLRNITGNCHYLCIMKNPRDSSFLACLGRQMNSGMKNHLMNYAYKESMSKPYGYLFIDLTQEQHDDYRIRDNLFPEQCTIFAPK